MSDKHTGLGHKIELSALLTVAGIILLFSTAVIVTLVAPRFIDPSWTQPTSFYQVQMYEVADPNLYISSSMAEKHEPQFVHHLKQDFSLLAFAETEWMRMIAPPELEQYITKYGDPILKLTSRILLLRKVRQGSTTHTTAENDFSAIDVANTLARTLQETWEKAHANWQEEGMSHLRYSVYELYDPHKDEVFVAGETEGSLENYIDQNYQLMEPPKVPYHNDPGVIYVKNPQEYRIAFADNAGHSGWRADPNGRTIANIEQLKSPPLGFLSRKELIEMGEKIYAVEGCWYCHSDQTRTLVQDVVLNGSESYPAPPSSPNEYIYQKVTFPSTRRIGPDLSRVGVLKANRDWHKAHFWEPKSASVGTIMPSFRHFFDNDPRGTSKSAVGVPNYKFEAVFQYLMTKGTRITPPTQAWWLGKDPVQTKAIIDRSDPLSQTPAYSSDEQKNLIQ